MQGLNTAHRKHKVGGCCFPAFRPFSSPASSLHWSQGDISTFIPTMLVFYCCSNQLPQTKWLKTTQTYSLTVL